VFGTLRFNILASVLATFPNIGQIFAQFGHSGQTSKRNILELAQKCYTDVISFTTLHSIFVKAIFNLAWHQATILVIKYVSFK
jgi:hypothetical protein